MHDTTTRFETDQNLARQILAERNVAAVVERAAEIADERARRIRAARVADRRDLLNHAAACDLLGYVDDVDECGAPILGFDAPDVCENPW